MAYIAPFAWGRMTCGVPDACPWCGPGPNPDPLYRQYHDTEWGVQVHTDRTLFEFLILEGAQAGLSWLTVLRKRPHYRRPFADFDAEQVVRFHAARISLTRPIVIYAHMQATGMVNDHLVDVRATPPAPRSHETAATDCPPDEACSGASSGCEGVAHQPPKETRIRRATAGCDGRRSERPGQSASR
jgi:hypothetical protein